MLGSGSTPYLGRLPRELVWSIIDYAPETVSHLRLASSALLRSVNAYALQKFQNPLLQTLDLHTPDPSKRSAIGIHFECEPSKHSLLKLRLRLKLAQYPFDSDFPGREYIRRNALWSTPGTYQFYVDNAYVRRSLFEFLSEWAGSRIEMLWITNIGDFKALSMVSKIYKEMKFSVLKYFNEILDYETANHLVEVAWKQNVDEVEIQVAHVTAPDPVDILQKLSSHVRSLRIIQLPLRSSYRTNGYFFGIHNHKWATVFVDMLASKLNKLHIDNTRYSGYLDHDSVKTIKQSLPRLGKQLWFVASCSVLTDVVPKYKIEDHLVQIDCNYEMVGLDHESHSRCKYHRLVIKHTSRQGEEFRDNE